MAPPPAKRAFLVRSMLDLPPTPPLAPTPPPTHRRRPFGIRDLLGSPPASSQQQRQSAPQIGSGSGKRAEDYVEMIDDDCHVSAKFKLTRCKGRFLIKALPAEPEGLLAGVFQNCIDSAVAASRSKGYQPDHLGVMITSPHLDPAIYIPIRKISPNTVDSILERFLHVAQSKKQQGITLWGDPFEVFVTTVQRSALPGPGSRRLIGSGKKLAPVHHQIKPGSLIQITQNDGNCFFYAMQATMKHATAAFDSRRFTEYVNETRSRKFFVDTMKLKQAVGAPNNAAGGFDGKEWLPKVIDYWNLEFHGSFKFRGYIFGSSGHYKPEFAYGPEDFDTPILLYYNEQHFDGVRSNKGLFGQNYCLACEAVYDRPKTHAMKCKARCNKCSKMSPGLLQPCPPFQGYRKECHGCSKTFFNNSCYRNHKANGFCSESKECKKCGQIWNVKLNTQKGRKGHKCGEKWCSTCRGFHDKDRGCYIRSTDPQDYTKPVRFVAFDLETTQHQLLDPSSPNNMKRRHDPNFIAAKVTCADCISSGAWKQSLKGRPCQVCGPNRTITFGERPYSETATDRHVVSNKPLYDFVQWILYGLPAKYSTYAYAHFGGRFDITLLCKELYWENLNPSMLKRGNKLYEMRIQKRKALKEDKKKGTKERRANPNVIFRDSWNLLNMKLELLPSSFGLDVEDKGFFPHLYNMPTNYGIRRQGLPPKDDYLYKGFMPKKKKEFDEWYDQHKNEEFFLDEALPSYCCNDVDILMAALIAFRSEFMEVSCRPENHLGEADRPSGKPHDGIDPLIECMTIASACMRHYRTNHLPDNHLALVPERGYDTTDTQSLLALKYFQYLEATTGKQIQHANKPGGEKRIAGYRVDGWIEEDRQVIEVNGCPWHGCAECWQDDEMTPTGLTAAAQRKKDEERLEKIRAVEPNIKVIWSHEIDEMLEEDLEMKKRFDEYLDEGPINIRSGFFGGRTGPLVLYYKTKDGEVVSYLDITSLYPFINSTVRYMIDHPNVHILNEDCNWTKPEDLPYQMALLKVFVIPPRKIDIPVLPVKFDKDERLLFPLCSSCAREYKDGGVDEDYRCEHTDRERGWVSTCTSVELYEALAEGYEVKKVYRVLEYTKSDDDLFKSYMREFLAQKFHASGFDSSIKGRRELEDRFIRECYERHGIELERAKMFFNQGKRALAKLALNNLWGRFSMRNEGLWQTKITDDPSVLGEFLDKRSIEVCAIEELTPESIMISYTTKREWIDEHECSNVVISLWTTSCARLLLLKLMQAVARTEGCTLLYTDTDSIIFAHPEGTNPFDAGKFPDNVKIPPILANSLPADWRPQIGPHLGDLTDEYPDHEILEYVSGGAKQYGLKLRRKSTGELEHVLKIRGFTLNEDVLVNQGLRYETFKTSVLDYARTGVPPQITVLYPNFIRSYVSKALVVSQPLRKMYKPFVGKGIVRPSDYKVLDFGYIPN